MATTTEKRVYRTKKTLSGVRSDYRGWKDWEEDDTIICKLVGSTPNRKNKSKTDWIVEPLEVFFADKKEQKRIKGSRRLTLNSAGQLDKGMEQVEEGSVIQIIYKGTSVMEGGEYAGQEAHNMEVSEVEEDDGSENPDEEETDDEDNGEIDDDENEDEDDL